VIIYNKKSVFKRRRNSPSITFANMDGNIIQNDNIGNGYLENGNDGYDEGGF